jgi:hypothetical protein
MRNTFAYISAALLCLACNESREVTVSVENPIGTYREGEMVEVSMADVVDKLQLADTAQIVVIGEDGQKIPYQITYDDKVIFPVAVKGNSTSTYIIKQGTPEFVATKSCGAYYAERLDDVAWENDLVAFRTYGPAFEKSGAKGYGYDIWTKYNTTEPVVEERYAEELNPETRDKIAELKANDPTAAEDLYHSISYHIDHGNGMDCYNVGPTLGGGTAAIMVGDTIIYPGCYATQEILDNGPLRFTVQLNYNPLVVETDSNVVETRIISLDAGSYLNKTVVTYSNLSKAVNVATGIVLHNYEGAVNADAERGVITYVDPTDNAFNDNGLIFVGAAFPDKLTAAKPLMFSDKEREEERRGAFGHLLAISEYQPGSNYTYYWGFAWSKAAIKDAGQWDKYVTDYAVKVRNPLIVKMK